MSPTARRRAVKYLQEECSYSERRACTLINHPRGTNRYIPSEDSEEERLIKELHRLAGRFPRYGYRRLTDKLREGGWRVNRKRVHRLCRQEGLKVLKRRKKRVSRQKAPVITVTRKNQVWSYDFVFDQTSSGRTIKMLTVLDLHTRECHAIEVERRMSSAGVVKVLKKLFMIHGAPEYIRSDNGSEFVAKHVQAELKRAGVRTQYITPGSPWQNGHIESFHDKFRDECLNRELFYSLIEARVVVEDWRVEYNTVRPHSSIGRIPPAAYAAGGQGDMTRSVVPQGLPTGGCCADAARPLRTPLWITHA